jgi:nicotinamidase-related amidase
MESKNWLDESNAFLLEIDRWLESAETLPIEQFTDPPERSAIISVDVINGFCYQGPLASDRIAGIVQPIVNLFSLAWENGIRHILLAQDAHVPDAIEFAQFPPHCIRNTDEADAVPEIRDLPFYEQMVIFPKNSIHSGLNTDLNDWIKGHPQVDQFIVVGDCTDLCTYQLAMHLRLEANARQLNRRVVLPLDCVDTYDLTIRAAKEIGGQPHNAELLHRVFLYSMRLNGIEIAASLTG